MPARPDWAGLPLEIWQTVYLLAAGDDRRHTARDASLSWVQWVRLVAVGSTVCTALRTALTGPCASALWDYMGLRSAYQGLDAQQSWAMNVWLLRQGCHFRDAAILGGSWELPQLQTVLASITSPNIMRLEGIHTAAEAQCISTAVLGCAAGTWFYAGSQCIALPPSVHALYFGGHWPATGSASRHAQELFACLQPLSSLRRLHLQIIGHKVSAANVASLQQWYPQLKHLELRLSALTEREARLQAVGELRRLQAVRLRLDMTFQLGSMATPVLEQLNAVRLCSLTLTVQQGHLDVAQEALLAQCCIREQLTLRCSDAAWRLQQPLAPRVQVVYKPLA